MQPSEHRRVEIESVDDLRGLVEAARLAAQEKIDLCLPRHEGADGRDELRARVEEAVQAYIGSTYEGVLTNISINGVDAESLYSVNTDGNVISKNGSTSDEESYEPFNQALAANVQALAEQVESLTADVAAARSTVPAAAAAAFTEKYLALAPMPADVDVDVSGSGQDSMRVGGEDDGDDTTVKMQDPFEGLPVAKRWPDVEATWARTAEELLGLARMKETTAKVDVTRERVLEAVAVAKGM